MREAKCGSCVEKYQSGLSIAGRCNKCVAISNKERRHAQRRAEGLPDIPIRDSSFCHVCNIPKTDGRCVPCRQRMARERKAKKREEAGKRPWGSGRPLTCYKCNALKEKPRQSYCNKCQSEYSAKRWAEVIAPRIVSRVKTDKCRCGNERASYSKSYCVDCISQFGKKRREMLRASGFVAKRMPPQSKELRKQRQAVRNITNAAIRAGYLMRQPCEICHTSVNIEAHHDDYAKPLDVRWLCKLHHIEHHNNEFK